MFRGSEESRDRRDAVEREVARVAVGLGRDLHDRRVERQLSMRDVAEAAGVSATRVHDIEAGAAASLETYVRLAAALGLKADFGYLDPRKRERVAPRAEDPVHAAMGDIEAEHFQRLGLRTGLDEPFQHYQFAGRVDVTVVSAPRPALLAIENRTAFPNFQEMAGAFNAKCAYFAAELARRLGVRSWDSQTHVIVALWSAEVLHQLRLHAASFAALCPDNGDAWHSWWRGELPERGVRRVLVLFDPIEGSRSDRARYATCEEIPTVRPRYAGYADALRALHQAGRA